MRWDKNHDFTQLHQECIDRLSGQDIETKCKKVLESRRVINRRWVDENNLNRRQKIAHDLVVKAVKLNNGKPATDGVHDFGRLQSLLGKGGSGKSRVLGAVVTALKDNGNHFGDNFFVMEPTEKRCT